MPKEYAHDFYEVIQNHAEKEAEAQKNDGTFATHPLEFGEEGGTQSATTSFYQTEKYDYFPRYQQFNMSDTDQCEALEKLMARIVNGDGVLRREQTSSNPRGDFIILVAWLERKEKKQPRKAK